MAAAERHGGPHVIVCNAATDFTGSVEETSLEDWNRVLAINLTGVYLCARAAMPRMRTHGGGSIVNIASVNAFWLEPDLAAYATAKGGVIALTRSIAIDAGREGIRCNCVCPGYIDTGMAQRYFDLQAEPGAARAEAGRCTWADRTPRRGRCRRRLSGKRRSVILHRPSVHRRWRVECGDSRARLASEASSHTALSRYGLRKRTKGLADRVGDCLAARCGLTSDHTLSRTSSPPQF